MVPPELSRRHSTIGAATAFLLLTTGCTPPAKRITPAAESTAAETTVAQGQTVDGPLHGRTTAYLIVGDAASTVRVRLADLPGLLYRIGTPAGAGLSARVTGPSGRVHVDLRANGDPGPDALTIVLNRAVRWDIRLPAGGGELRLDLHRGRVTRVDLGACGLADLALPRPRGVVPITLTDAVGTLRVAAPKGTPVTLTGAVRTGYRITARAGVGRVTVDH
jgi:hypothetical protein